MSRIEKWLKLKYICEQVFEKGEAIKVVHKENTGFTENDFDFFIDVKFSEDFTVFDDAVIYTFSKALKNDGFELKEWRIICECENEHLTLRFQAFVKEVDAE